MPKLFSTLLFLISIQVIGQSIKLQGRYIEDAGIIVKTITFDDNEKRFSFTHFRSAPDNTDASVNGTGTYRIKGDTLFLFYDNNTPQTKVLKKHEIIGEPTANNKTDMNVQVIDAANGKPIPGCSLTFEFDSKRKVFRTTDTLSNAFISLKASDYPITITATTIDYATDSLAVQTAGNYDIRLFLTAFSKETINNGQVAAYKIRAISDDTIELTPLNSTTDWKSRYRKQRQPTLLKSMK